MAQGWPTPCHQLWRALCAALTLQATRTGVAPPARLWVVAGSMVVMDVVQRAAERRNATLAGLDATGQAQKGQFFTPLPIAQLMAAMPVLPRTGTFRIVDPGAGSGMLTAAIMARIAQEAPELCVSIVAVEEDPALIDPLRATLRDCETLGAETQVITDDYVSWATASDRTFDLVIQNPPYHKIGAKSAPSVALRRVGIAAPNMYAAFMALGAKQLAPQGQQVSITPRSWMNGTYFDRFREYMFRHVSLRTIHTFESRSKVFGDMNVLQESIIVHSTASLPPKQVRVQSSRDQAEPAVIREVPYQQVVAPDVVFVPATARDVAAIEWMSGALFSLADLGLAVSTGRVVDFRCRDWLVNEPVRDSYPMVYPANLTAQAVSHPRPDLGKPQWLTAPKATREKLLVPAGTYVLVKRFSAKEEKRRLVATIWEDRRAPAFDNKLNYLHAQGQGLDPDVARGLAAWLNSSIVDDYFRVFSGHTQVNATDLRRMKFPSVEQLVSLGSTTGDIDQAVRDLLTPTTTAAA